MTAVSYGSGRPVEELDFDLPRPTHEIRDRTGVLVAIHERQDLDDGKRFT